MKKNSGVIIASVVSVVFVGTAIYFISKALRKKGQDLGDGGNIGTSTLPTTQTTQSNVDVKPRTNLFDFLNQKLSDWKINPNSTQETFTDFKFPMKKGNRNSSVKKLQQLILQVDKTLLPKFGADGDFGSETENAIASLIGKKSVDNQSDVEKIKNVAFVKGQKLLMNQTAFGNLGLQLFK
jgi:hypothetical protein